MSGPQTEKACRPSWVLVRRTTADLAADDRSWRRCGVDIYHVCFRFLREFLLRNKRPYSFHILRDKFNFMQCSECFCSKNYKRSNASEWTGIFLAHSVTRPCCVLSCCRHNADAASWYEQWVDFLLSGTTVWCYSVTTDVFVIIPAKARDYVFTGVGLFVCLSVCLLPRQLNKTWTDLDEIFWEGS